MRKGKEYPFPTLQDKRREAGHSQESMAKVCECSVGFIRQFEQGENRLRYKTLELYSKELKMDKKEVLDIFERMYPEMKRSVSGLRKLREDLGISSVDMSKMINLSVSSICFMESGRVKPQYVSPWMFKYIEILGITFDELREYLPCIQKPYPLELYRTEQGFTVNDIAKELNMSRQGIYNFEQGKTFLRPENLHKYVRFIDGDEAKVRHLFEESSRFVPEKEHKQVEEEEDLF